MTWLIAFLFWVYWKYAVNQLDMLCFFLPFVRNFMAFGIGYWEFLVLALQKGGLFCGLLCSQARERGFYYSVGYLVLLGIWSVHGKPVYSVW